MKAALACGGWVVLMLLSSLLVGAECADGWNSPSIVGKVRVRTMAE